MSFNIKTGLRSGRWLALSAVVLFLAFYNVSIAQKEIFLEQGRRVVLALRPLDPRSLMQGDYMILQFQIERDISRALPELAPRRGLAVLRLENGEHKLARLHGSEPLAEGELLLEFKQIGGGIKVSSGSFFFEEGQAKTYEQARYAELRVRDDGKAMISALLDEDLKVIKKNR